MKGQRAAGAYRYADFTEQSYARLIRAARANYSFELFGTRCAQAHVLLRHDVDMSVHRALRIASIEAQAGVRSTYFLLPHSQFYNLLERGIAQMVRRIARLGHAIGLHFDTGYHGGGLDARRLARAARRERILLQDVAGVAVNAISFHDPTSGLLKRLAQPLFGGMINAYGAGLRDKYKYCSDSNGYWRFDRLHDLLESGAHPRLHVLTHPEWWVPSALSPYDRVRRCVDGRSDAVLADYAAGLRLAGRRNVGA